MFISCDDQADNSDEMSSLIFSEKQQKNLECHLLHFFFFFLLGASRVNS